VTEIAEKKFPEIIISLSVQSQS